MTKRRALRLDEKVSQPPGDGDNAAWLLGGARLQLDLITMPF